MSVILGIDPGSRVTGWGIISTSSGDYKCVGHGVFNLGADRPFTERLGLLLTATEALIAKYKPDCLAVEKVFMAKNADSAFKLGHARGVIVSVAARAGLPVHEYATRHAKKMLTGSGAASKEQVQFLIENMLSIRAEKLDATDALALAVCHAREAEISAALLRQGHSREGVST